MVAMTDRTMSLNIHVGSHTSGRIAVDEVTKQITHDFTHEPHAAKGVGIPDDVDGAARLADLALHRIDLGRAWRFLDEIKRQGGVQAGKAMSLVCMALWQAALVSAMKCFQHSNARSEKLRGRVVFEGDTDLRSFFNELMRLRNKHVVHHENDWMQAYLVAIVTVPG
jgi:hypothetical protein